MAETMVRPDLETPTRKQATLRSSRPAEAAKPGRLDAWARRQVLAKLELLRGGEVRLIEGETERTLGRGGDLRVTLRVHDPRFWSRIAFGGSIGAGEAYMDDLWSSDDLTSLVRLLVRNRDVLEGLEGFWKTLAKPFERLRHFARANTRGGSRRNIAEHYDLSNDFFALFLDPEMMYSAAVFDRPHSTLEEASLAKLERLCRKLRLGPSDHLLEIGTGWGGLAVYAAKHFGCRVTTTTISRKQFEHALERVAREGLEDRVEILLCDYRDLEGTYDKLVSVEMIEAVGLEHLPTFFRKCGDLLKPHGLMALQAITIADRHYESAARSVDFIQRYIFPGSAIPSIGSMHDAVVRETDMTMVHLEDIGLDYARTLAAWRERFLARLEDVRALGFDDRFCRMWEFYLCYCEGGFLERSISDIHMMLAKPDWRGRLVGETP